MNYKKNKNISKILVLSGCLFLLFCCFCLNTTISVKALTSSEWIMTNWLNYPDNTGQWGVSTISGKSALGSTQNVGWTGFLNTYALNDKNYTFDFKMIQNTSGDDDNMGWTFRHTYSGDYSISANHSYYTFVFNGVSQNGGLYKTGLYKKTKGINNWLGTILVDRDDIRRVPLTEYNTKIVVNDETGGTRIKIYLDNTLIINYLDSNSLPMGGYGPFSCSQAYAYYYDIYVNGSSIDNIPPSITVTAPTQNNKYLITDNINLIGTAQDIGIGNIGTISTYYHLDNSADTLIWTKTKTGSPQAFNVSIPIPDTLKYGNHTLTTWAKDDKNAESKKIITNFFINDITAPTTLNLSENTTAFVNGNVIITAIASDDSLGSGIQKIKTPDGNFVIGSTANYTVSSNGTYIFVAYDVAGNSKIQSITVNNIDKTAPTGTITQNPTLWTNSSVILTATGTDTQSGVKSITKPDGTVTNGSTTTYTINSNGTYNFIITDNVGNIVTKSYAVTNIDKVNPTLSWTQDIKAYTTRDVVITATATDGESGVSQIQTPDGKWINSSVVTYTAKVSGNYQFAVKDIAGNITIQRIYINNIDIEAPTSMIVHNATWTNGSTTINIKATDDMSGVKEIILPDGNIIPGDTATYTVNDIGVYYFKAVDNVGNIGINYIVVSNIDKNKPAVIITNNKNWSNANSEPVIITATDN